MSSAAATAETRSYRLAYISSTPVILLSLILPFTAGTHQGCFHGTCIQVISLNLFSLIFGELGPKFNSYPLQFNNFSSKALGYDSMTVICGIAKAVSLPCHHNVQPYIMVTGHKLQAEGLHLCHLSKQKIKNSTQEIWLAEDILLTLQALVFVFVGGCLRRDLLANDSPKPSQAAELNKVIKTYCVGFVKLPQLGLSGVIEPIDSEWCLQGFYPYSHCNHNIKKEYQGHKMVTIADMSYDHFKTRHTSLGMNHNIFILILYILDDNGLTWAIHQFNLTCNLLQTSRKLPKGHSRNLCESTCTQISTQIDEILVFVPILNFVLFSSFLSIKYNNHTINLSRFQLCRSFFILGLFILLDSLPQVCSCKEFQNKKRQRKNCFLWIKQKKDVRKHQPTTCLSLSQWPHHLVGCFILCLTSNFHAQPAGKEDLKNSC
ncbi:hypothetical protein VP01_3193g1 [Puccinia sorghi]|uniref:Uncharacterized protein n=1 Tax=Puccinia sorghi TaxID=27349 RepID=A0A0L6UYI4_9BASI|nr:hypothetical protein VP01_3193g1 [Puccinia sorghi]